MHLFVEYRKRKNKCKADTQAGDTTSKGNYKDEIKVSEWTQEYMGTFIEDFEKNKRRKIKKRKV